MHTTVRRFSMVRTRALRPALCTQLCVQRGTEHVSNLACLHCSSVRTRPTQHAPLANSAMCGVASHSLNAWWNRRTDSNEPVLGGDAPQRPRQAEIGSLVGSASNHRIANRSVSAVHVEHGTTFPGTEKKLTDSQRVVESLYDHP